MPVAAIDTYDLVGLTPYSAPQDARTTAVRISPGLTNLPKGAVLAESTLNANAVHTLAANTASAGTFKLTFRGYTTGVLNFNDTPATVVAALNALPSVAALGSVVGGGTNVNGAGLTITWSGSNWANTPVELPTITIVTAFVGASLTIVSTTTGSRVGTAVPYVNGGANGSGTPKWLNQFRLSTDSAGNVINSDGTQSTGSDIAFPRLTAPVFYAGNFLGTDIPQAAINGITGGFLDSAGATTLGRFIQGTFGSANSVLRLQ